MESIYHRQMSLRKMRVETRDYVFQCQIAEATTIRKPLIDGIKTFLSPTTSPIFALNIHRILIQYTKGYKIPPVNTHPTDTPYEIRFKNIINEIIAKGPQKPPLWPPPNLPPRLSKVILCNIQYHLQKCPSVDTYIHQLPS